MLTEGGTEAMLGSLDESVTAVATFGARDTVTRSVPGVPLGSVSVAGVMLVTTGGGGVTCTRVAALVPLTEAVTFATVGASFASAMTISASCATLMVTVRLPVAPSCSGRGLGRSETMAAA